MTPIKCKRPTQLLPKAIGETHVFNIFDKARMLTAITSQGRLYLAYETPAGVELRDKDGHTMEKGPVHRYFKQHIQALKNGASLDPRRNLAIRSRGRHGEVHPLALGLGSKNKNDSPSLVEPLPAQSCQRKPD